MCIYMIGKTNKYICLYIYYATYSGGHLAVLEVVRVHGEAVAVHIYIIAFYISLRYTYKLLFVTQLGVVVFLQGTSTQIRTQLQI